MTNDTYAVMEREPAFEREARRVYDRTLRDAAPVLLDLCESLLKHDGRRDEALAVVAKLRAGAPE